MSSKVRLRSSLQWNFKIFLLNIHNNFPKRNFHISSWRITLSLYHCPLYHVLSFFFFSFLEPHLWHMEVPSLEIKLELQLQAYTTVTAMWDLSHICDLHHSSRQCQILNLLREARDRTRNLMDTSQTHLHWATMGIPLCAKFEVWPLLKFSL